MYKKMNRQKKCYIWMDRQRYIYNVKIDKWTDKQIDEYIDG